MSLLIRNFLLSLLLAVPLGAGAEPYTQTAFERLQKEGAPILVSIYADWRPTCRAQAPIVQSLLEQNPYRRIQLLRVDFDEQKDIVRAFRASMQSTLIVFKEGREVGRSVGDTSEAGIAALLGKAL